MNTGDQFNEKQKDVERQTAEWVLKQDRGLTATEQDEFAAWLSSNSLHKETYAHYQWGWDEIDRLVGVQSTHGLQINPDIFDEVPVCSIKNVVTFVIKASLPIAAILVLIFSLFYFEKPTIVDENEVHTQPVVVERIQREVLDDGSIIELNRGAEIRVDYSSDKRLVYLLKGEANFDVAKNPNRPFVVVASGFEFQALGTVFVIRHGESNMDLIVSEGRVKVSDSRINESRAIFSEETIVDSSQMAVINMIDDEPVFDLLQLSKQEIESELYWRPVLFEFNDETLGHIVKEFNRKNKIKITISDPSLNSIRLSSLFWSDNVEAFVRLLITNFGMCVEHVGDDQIVLGRQFI